MDLAIKQHMYRIVDDYIHVEDLNRLLKSFITDKEQETSVWGKITITTHRMLGGSSLDIERIAAATELMILTLDIVDDLQDRDQADKPWIRCPEGYTLNAVLAMIMGFIGDLGKVGLPASAFAEISQIVTRAVNGQQKDMNDSVVTGDDYLLMVQEKSGSVFRLACYMGCAALTCSEATLGQLQELADCIGLLHQIQNDVRDVVRFDVKSDVLGRKRTLPVLYLLAIEDAAFDSIKDYYAGRITADVLLAQQEQLVQIIENSGCMEYARVVQSVCVQKAEEIYGSLHAAAPWKEQFKELTFGSFCEV
ncbi:polyprenyl synthetase family protein [Paenibacillus aestuarii]|uniref:Polyprenyl synthetase family protein n=1 Tax=Paenibacillus aestuarii TaxID=516965 RepID=A0ABW0KH11_9BACL|nr:polyprenyl synthetase family protein [Paenibacillus aestuarii]